MPNSELSIIVEGHTEELLADAFLSAVGYSLEVLKDLDVALSNKRRGTLRWALGKLQYGSPAVMTVRAVPPIDERDYGADVIRQYLQGITQLTHGEGLPPAFSDDALESLKKLARLGANGTRPIKVQHEKTIVEITERIAVNVNELLGRTYESNGSIEGILEMATIHERRYFRVYDAIYGWGVPCHFGPQDIKLVRTSFGNRVSVSGRLRRDRSGKPLSMIVEGIRVFRPEEDLPTPKEIRGIAKGMTDGKLAEDYLREIRENGNRN